jgi:alpha-glucoside transport system permease protein
MEEAMDSRLFTAIVVVVGVPAVLVGYIYLVELGLRAVSARFRDQIRPWFWLAPALLLLFVFLILPTIGTIVRSFQNQAGTDFIGLDNYAWFFGSDDALIALRNSALWVIFLTGFCVGLGLLIAVLVDRVRFESIAKSVIFVPLAISMVAAGVIWRFMYAYEAPGTPQTGFLNGVLAAFGIDPVPWLTIDTLAFNTILLIVVMTWMWTGFAMVILSAALKGISPELLEAARVDGATEWRVFRYITFPLLLPTVAVVSTTIIITALKAFDIVYTMTNGAFDTDNIALLMYKTLNNGDFGRSSAVAVVLLLAIVPIMALNINRFRAQEAVR